jgi:hypothetical protein
MPSRGVGGGTTGQRLTAPAHRIVKPGIVMPGIVMPARQLVIPGLDRGIDRARVVRSDRGGTARVRLDPTRPTVARNGSTTKTNRGELRDGASFCRRERLGIKG